MSQRRGRLAEIDFDSVVEEVRDWYHVPTLVLLMSFMFWVRAQTWDRFTQDGRVLFSGNDAWYHYRQTAYTVRNWPETMPFEVWSRFPYGTDNGQFGTLLDQLAATASLIVGLGSPSDQTIAFVVLFTPVVIGVLVAIPVYLGGKQLGGRFGGLVGVLVLALTPGGFLNRSMVGFSDHHIAEVFFQMLAVVGFLAALHVAKQELPVWELVSNREWDALRRPVGWSVLAGVAATLYIWTWPPGVLLFGILGLYFALQLTIDYLRGNSPEPVAFVGVVGLGVTGLLTLVPLNALTFQATDFTLLQPFMALAVAAGCVFMAWLARAMDERDIDRRAYPLLVALAGVLVTGLLAVATPDLFDYLVANAQRILASGSGAGAGTVGEAQPLRQPIVTLFTNYGLAFISAAVAAIALLVQSVRGREFGSRGLLVVVWAAVLVLATLSQRRFEYYLVLPIALLNAYLVRVILMYISPSERISEVETFQVVTVLTVLLIIVAPLAIGVGSGPSTAVARGQINQPSGGVVGWTSGLDWMEENTPAPGEYGGADNQLDYYGTYGQTEDYDYPDGGYGVMSWWDYGHWITVRGERIPVANPFQEGPRDAANFLLAPNETRANEVLEENSEGDAQTRYVVVDWKMVNEWSRRANGKFFAPIVFYGDDPSLTNSDFYRPVYRVSGTSAQVRYYVKSQRYYDSMVNRLWYYHGSSQAPQPVAVNYEERTFGDGQTFLTEAAGNQSNYRVFGGLGTTREQGVQQARQFVREDGTAQVGGIGPNPPGYVPALEHYRLVHNSNTSALNGRYLGTLQQTFQSLAGNTRGLSEQQQLRLRSQLESILLPNSAAPPWLKVFERVPGATIRGTAPANTNVTATVPMRAPTNGENFTYTQRVQTGPDGEFELTVPYSTTGYDNWGPKDGYTNVSVRARGDYQISTDISVNESGYAVRHTATTDVTEAQVIGEDGDAVTVDLEREVLSEPRQIDDGSSNSTDDGSTSDGSTDSSGSTNSTDSQSSLTGPAAGRPVASSP